MDITTPTGPVPRMDYEPNRNRGEEGEEQGPALARDRNTVVWSLGWGKSFGLRELSTVVE
jgi:hypothetical protein